MVVCSSEKAHVNPELTNSQFINPGVHNYGVPILSTFDILLIVIHQKPGATVTANQ